VTAATVPAPAVSTRLGEASIFTPARERMMHLARVYPVDRLLAVFRANAGLDTRGAEPPGNWEGFGHPEEQPWGESDYPGREHAPSANLLRGHYAGHFLSMLAKAYAGSGEVELRDKAWAMVDGLAEVQAALAATGRYSHPGFLAAYGEWQFSRLEGYAPYGEIWAPWYTTHKILAGLLDAWELTGSARALQVAEQMGHWAHGRLSVLPQEQRQKMWSLYIAGEFGGMNESLARLAAATSDPSARALFLEAARFFDQENLLEAGADGRDVLDGMHANQHLPQLIGYVHEYRATGQRRYLDTARTLFDQVVPGRMYAHGGSGEGELWGPADTVAGDIGPRNAETCVAYNLVKLAKELLAVAVEEGDVDGAERYADYVERALVNQVLGSRRATDSDTSPEVTYMFPVDPGALREYDNVGTCCGGTGLENHVTHQDSVALEAGGDLWLLLYTDAVITWSPGAGESGEELVLRIETDGPFGDRVRLRVESAPTGGVEATVQCHVPRWVQSGTDLVPGSFHRLARRWRTGDVVELDLPMALVATPTIDDPALYSLSYGPTVLLARSERTTPLELPLEAVIGEGGVVRGDVTPSADGTLELLGTTFEPCWSGGDARYHMYVRASDHGGGDPEAIRILTDVVPAPSGWFTTVPRVRVEAAEDGVELRVDDGAWIPSPEEGIALPGDGRFRVEARVTTSDGTSQVVSRELSVDTTPPTTRADVKDLGAAVEITLWADDDGSGVDRIQWEGPGTFWGTFHEAFVRTLGDEEQVIEFAATDRAGNQEERQRVVLPARER
jgi:DUF1680 family protein